MPYRLWWGEKPLGESELDMTTSSSRAGLFRPTPAFEAVRPVFERRQAIMKRSTEVLQARRADLHPAESMRRALRETGVGPALVENDVELRGLGLVLRDASGAPVTGTVNVWEMEIPPFPDLTAEQRAAIEADFAEAGMKYGGPNYVLVLLPARFGQALPNDATPA